LSQKPCLIKVINTALSETTKADEIASKTAKTGNLTAVVAVMSILKRKRCELQSANIGNERPSCQKAERANFPEENTCGLKSLSQKSRKGQIHKKLAPKLKKLELNCTNLMLNSKDTCSDCPKTPDPSVSSGLYVKYKTIRVLLDSGSSGDLIFMKKGSSKCISIVKRVVPQSRGTSNGTFVTDKVGDIKISFVEYLASKKVRLQPDIVEYSPGDQAPMYDLIIGMRTMHVLGAKLNFQEKTITIDEILLPTRNIANLQLKPRITRALRENTCFAQEPIHTHSATKRMVKILDTKYEKADLPAIIRENYSHLTASNREKLLSVLLKFELLFDGRLGDWKLPPVSSELREGMKPYHCRSCPIPHKHKAVLMKEIKRLCNIGVLEWQPSSRWVSPAFIIPKKDSTVRTISDFRELNKRIVRKPYPIPKINTILQELKGFTYATALDLNMGYYTIRLDPKVSEMSTIIFPLEKSHTRDYPWVLEAQLTYSKPK
jgi:hypothetical protein